MQDKTETKKPDAPTADISFEVGFGKDKTRFDMNMISVADEQEIQQQFNDLSDSEDDKAENEYRICLKALARHAAPNATHPNKDFSAFNIRNERIIRKAYLTFKEALEPETSFF